MELPRKPNGVTSESMRQTVEEQIEKFAEDMMRGFDKMLGDEVRMDDAESGTL